MLKYSNNKITHVHKTLDGARYLMHYTEKRKKSNNPNTNTIEWGKREREESVRKQREVTGFIHAKGRGYAQTDTIPYRPGRRSSWSPTPGEHRNVPPESRSTVDTNTVSPRYSAGRGTHTELSYRVPKAQVKHRTQLSPQHPKNTAQTPRYSTRILRHTHKKQLIQGLW